MTGPIELSIVSTVYNDGKVVPLFVEEITKSISSLGISFEIILVNDFSRDNTEEQIKQVCSKYENVKAISLARNYGKQIAVSAGMRYAKGNYVLVMDSDLENPVNAVSGLYHKAKEGYDIVYAVAKKRQTFFKRLTSEMFWI